VIGRSTITAIKDEVQTAWFGTILNASSDGIAISMSRRFEPGAALIVEVAAIRKGNVRFQVRVVHATPEQNGRWNIGCAFLAPGPNEEDPAV
jgi:hypothetical protein